MSPRVVLPSMAADFNWAIGGEAGDGIDSTGKIFAQALSRAGRHVFTSKDFASRIRGGYTAYKVRTAVDSVQSVVDRLDVLIALTQRTVDENMDELHEGSVIIYDGERTSMEDLEVPEEMIGLDVPLKRLAEDAGGAIMRNIVALGAACTVADFPIEHLDSSLQKRFGDKGQSIVDNNKEAARKGKEYVEENYDEERFEYDLDTTDEDYVLLNGDEAIGMGAIAAGCRYYAGYPITPATDVMEYLTGRIDQFGGHVVQAEDELSAINLALGAARAGARSMTATSGPGIDLMTETFGLVATSETPLVICDVQRSGPSTGMPTKQEQADINTTLYGGHGEVPRLVLAPTTISECFWKTVEAFNLAEKYQIPVFLLSDLSMAVTEQTFSPEEFDMDAVEVDRGKLVDGDVEEWQNEKDQFQPHALTEDGVSPRALPGTDEGAHMTTGLEHDELGRRTEDTEMRVEQVDKRNRKVETAEREEEWDYREFGDEDADALVVSWGSNEGAMVEAMRFLDEDGFDVRFISVPYIFPRPDLSEEIEAADDVIVVECNNTGQFADVLEHDALTRVKRVNKYNGVRFKADELADDIKDVLGQEVKAQ